MEEVDLADTHAEDMASALSMGAGPVGRLVQEDRKVDPDANIPVRLLLSSKDGEHSHIHLREVGPVPLLMDHAQALIRLLPLAACDVVPRGDQRCFRTPHYAKSQMVGVQELKGPVESVDHREP